MPYQQRQKNRPIATLIKLYIDKKSGKVSDARKELQKRFDYLDWKDQKRIIFAFLQSGATDRQWAYGKIYSQWDKCYLKPIKALWEKYHEDMCAWSIIQHFPIKYVQKNAIQLEETNGYYHLCQRLAEDPNYCIDRSKLQDKEYLLVMLNTHREVKEEEARDIFFKSVHEYCLMGIEYFFDLDFPAKNIAFSVDNIKSVISLKRIFYLLGFENLNQSIEEWNYNAMFKMYSSDEFKRLNQEIVDDEDYRIRWKAIGLKYLYQSLDEQYKKPTDEPYIRKLNDRIGEKTLQQEPDKFISKRTTFQNPPDAPAILKEMIAKNPIIAKLVDSFTLTEQIEEDLPF